MTETTPTPTALETRQAEVDQYTANIAMYQTILTSLPTEYPAHLAQFKGSKDKHNAIATVEDLDDDTSTGAAST